MYFDKKRRKTLASRPRPVFGVKPGSTALKRNRGVSRANAITVARMALLRRGVGVRARHLGAAGFPLAARARLRGDIATAAETGGLGGLALGIFDAGGDEDDVRTVGEMRHERLGQRERAEVVRRERHVPAQRVLRRRASA